MAEATFCHALDWSLLMSDDLACGTSLPYRPLNASLRRTAAHRTEQAEHLLARVWPKA
jgi:hypothetical protein